MLNYPPQTLARPFAWFEQPLDKLGLFSVAWALATITHQFTFTRWLWQGIPLGWILSLLALLLLAFPQVTLLLVAITLCSVSYTYSVIPHVPNHIFFEWWINLSFVVTFLIAWYRSDWARNLNQREFREKLAALYIPVAISSLIVLYLWTFVHKLNTDYFNAYHSCSVYLLEGMVTRINGGLGLLGITPISYDFPMSMRWGSVWGSLFFEALIPLLLIFRKTRIWGVGIGIFFHSLLAIHPHYGIYSFSAMLMGLYVFFVPERSVNAARNYLGKRQYLLKGKTPQWLAAGLLLIFFVGAVVLERGFPRYQPMYKLGLMVWLVISGLSAYLWWRMYQRPVTRVKLTLLPVLYIFPILIFLNGLSPYLGLKTESAFSMFSNLRTETASNHLLFPETMKVFDYQEDIVKVHDSSSPIFVFDVYHEADIRMYTVFEFKRRINELLAEGKDMTINFTYQDEAYLLELSDGQVNLPEWAELPAYWKLKTLYFRPIYAGPSLCQH